MMDRAVTRQTSNYDSRDNTQNKFLIFRNRLDLSKSLLSQIKPLHLQITGQNSR